MNLTTIAWRGEDGSANNIWKMQRIYNKVVDKEAYPDFIDWLYDMERSGTYICHDFTDKFLPYEEDEPDFCPVCGSHQVYEHEQNWHGSSYISFKACDDCGSTFSEVYEYKDTQLTRIGG